MLTTRTWSPAGCSSNMMDNG